MVGTAVKKVIGVVIWGIVWEGRNGAANLFQTAAGLNGNKNSIEDPARRGAIIAFTVPWM